MNYRQMGKTGLRVTNTKVIVKRSVIGILGMGMSPQVVVD